MKETDSGAATNLTDSAAVNNLKVFALKVFAREIKKKEAEWLTDIQTVLDQCDPKLAQGWVGGTSGKEVAWPMTARRRTRSELRSVPRQESPRRAVSIASCGRPAQTKIPINCVQLLAITVVDDAANK
jgi:hypothetical protein